MQRIAIYSWSGFGGSSNSAANRHRVAGHVAKLTRVAPRPNLVCRASGRAPAAARLSPYFTISNSGDRAGLHQGEDGRAGG
jgi:hypothetical protein